MNAFPFLEPSESSLPFIMIRRQLPVITVFTITVRKSQGQSFVHADLYFSEAVFRPG
jgi:hypothetical protein